MAGARAAAAQETPYFVTYSHHLEEPGNLEIELSSIYGSQKQGNDFIAPWVEFEYGAKAWWTTEFYLDWQGTFHDSALFTGFRWENRFRPLMREHWINPVLYVEYENITDADKTMIEVVGFDSQADHAVPNSESQQNHQHELEDKVDSLQRLQGLEYFGEFHRREKSGTRSWEFGYAVGASRPLRLAATSSTPAISAARISWWARKFMAGWELRGTLRCPAHLITSRRWSAGSFPAAPRFRISPGFGLNDNSHRFILRWGLSYEIDGFGHRVRSLFR